MANAVREHRVAVIEWNNRMQRDREQWQLIEAHFDDPILGQRFVFPRCLCQEPIPNPSQDLKTALCSARSFKELCPLVRHAEVRLSFWGSRYIEVQGHQETLPIDALAERVMELIKLNPNFDQEERSHGKTIAPLIDQIYEQSDKQVAESGWFTKVFVFLRNIPNLLSGFNLLGVSRDCSGIRWIWKDCDKTLLTSFPIKSYHKFFKYYTKEQHQRDIGPVPEEHVHGGHGPGYAYWAPEDIPEAPMGVDELKSNMQNGWISYERGLQICAANGLTDFLTQIMENRYGLGQRIGNQDQIGLAIVFAAQNRHPDCLRLLLNKHPDALDLERFSRALNLAKFNGDLASIEILRAHLNRN